MELVIWGLLIGMVGMVWLLVAASIEEHESKDARRDREDRPAAGQEQAPPVHQERGMKAVA